MENNNTNIPENENPVENSMSADLPVPEEEVTAQPAETLPEPAEQPVAEQEYFAVQEPVAVEATKPVKKSGKLWKRLLCAVLAVVVVAGSCVTTAVLLNDSWDQRLGELEDRHAQEVAALEVKIKDAYRANADTNNNTGNSVSGSPVSAEGLTPSQVYARNVNAVVMITAEVTTGGMFGGTGTSFGTGFVLTPDGYVVTNCHVVEGANKLSVETAAGDIYDAVLVGYDSANDVAVLKIEEENMQAVTVGSSNALIVGDQVVAIGNPLGELTATLTVGYVSAKERNVNTDGTVINMIQTDAAINSGNSGGPLFNMKGEVVGITTAKYSGTSNSGATIEGIGFAIPIDDVYDMIDDLVNYGYITGAYLGISVGDTDPDAAAYFGVPTGAYVYEVVPGYCAEEAGVKAKDVIVKLGGYTVSGLNDLSRALRNLEPGETTTVVVVRAGQQLELTITLDEKPQEGQP